MAYDVIVVLGARVLPDGTPSEALRRRLTLALSCYAKTPAAIICCGAQGPGEPEPEGDCMCRWLVKRGVPAERVFSENRSFDTAQNIRFAKAIMEENGLASALVVTSDYHVARALAICRRAGVAATGAGSPSEKKYWLKNHGRECLAWMKFCLRLDALWPRILAHFGGKGNQRNFR